MNVCFETFGCRLNRAEALDQEARYAAEGHEIVALDDTFPPDVIVVRGCSVTAKAERDCRKAIAHLRARFPSARIELAGCLAGASAAPSEDIAPQTIPTRTARAYLKVQDGCSCKCTFCIVPSFRGPPRSVPFAQALSRARAFFDAGYREIVVTGCNLALYRDAGHGLADLLASLADLPVRVELASEFRYRKLLFSDHALVIVVSQSGETAESLAALRAAKACGVPFGIMYNQRTNPVYRKMREIVKSGGLGEMKRAVWIITNWYRSQAYYDSGTWRATWAGEGGGVLINQCPHNLDLWQWICGMPSSVRAFMSFGKYHDIEVEDDVTIYAKYDNGATGLFITTTAEAPGTNRFEISGTKGKIVYDGKLRHWKLGCDERVFNAENKVPFAAPPCEYEEYDLGPSPEHRGILRNFTNHILYGEELIAPGIEGINGLSISNAAHLSEWTGNSEIELPNDGEAFLQELKKRIKTSRAKPEYSTAPVDISGTYNS